MENIIAPIRFSLTHKNSHEIQTLSRTESASIYGGVAAEEPQNDSQSSADSEESTDSENWSGSLQSLLDQPPSALPRHLLLGGIIFSLAFGAWAAFGKIDQVGNARGKLIPQGDVYRLHPVAGGKIEEIHIEEGESVNSDQVLVELEREISANEVERLQKQKAAKENQLRQTEALINETRLEADSRVAITQAQIEAQEAAIAQAKAQAQAQQETLSKNQMRATNQQELLQELKNDAAAQQERLQELQPLVEDGAIAAEVVFRREQALRDRQRTITQTQGELQQILGESQRLQAQRQQAIAQAKQLQAELNQKRAEGKMAQLRAKQKLQELQVQKTQLQAEMEQTQKLLTQAETQLQQLSLTAPVQGVVSSLNVSNVGEVVRAGQTVAEIAPQGAPLVLSASLPNREAGLVETGMPVKIKFDAYPFQDYGVVTGKVTSISPDTKLDERLGEVYKVEVTLDRNHVTANGKTIQLKAGQTGTAEIVIRRRRIADILFEPIRQLQEGGISL